MGRVYAYGTGGIFPKDSWMSSNYWVDVVFSAYKVSVKDFGAKGDGITDDTLAIQTAIDSVPATGGTVFVPAGDYRISNSIAIGHDNTILTGEGAASIIRLMDNANVAGIILPVRYSDHLDVSNVVHNVTISNLTLDGNHNPIIGSGGFGIFVRQASYVTISGMIIKNWSGDGISVSNGLTPNDHVTIENSRFTGVRRNGIHIGDAANTIIRGNYITDSPSQWWGADRGQWH